MADPPHRPEATDDSHRGGFGEFGGESRAFIERTFRERIVVVGVVTPDRTEERVDASLDELALLVDTAGADVVDRLVQRRDAPDPGTFIGRGKAEELQELAEALDVDTVVFDDELSPAQQFNLERILGRTALDRTAVILDIFAQNAHSRAGKAQVELALLRYRLPRLRGRGVQLSRQAGAMGAGGARAPIGSRGPGETQLEVDRRRILRRIHKLEAELGDVVRVRRVQRKRRGRARNLAVSLVGYTNAGKSTLLNALTDAGASVEDRLFATLEPTTRQLHLPGGERVLMSDTVGFIRSLPHQLVEAFKSTLEVVTEADLLVHVVDAGGDDPDGQIAAVRGVLDEIGAGEVPELLVFNKLDAAPDAGALAAKHPGAVAVSARERVGVERLLEAMSERLRRATTLVELVVPYARGDVVAAVHREGQVLEERHEPDATHLTARLDDAAAARFAEFADAR